MHGVVWETAVKAAVTAAGAGRVAGLPAARRAVQCVAEEGAQRWRAGAQQGAGTHQEGLAPPPRLPRKQAKKTLVFLFSRPSTHLGLFSTAPVRVADTILYT